jgi:hypothetical protein
MNVFRGTPDRSLDRIYLRTCAIYRLLKSGRIGQARAIELQRLPIKGAPRQSDRLIGLIEIWKAGPLKNMQP